MAFRTFITKSRAGHYRATVKRVPTVGSEAVFKSERCSTKDAARRQADQFIAEQAAS